MWVPTHVQVTIQKAVGLLTKGKNNTNDCFVTIGLGKIKYQTSVKEKAGTNVEWHEECELSIPEQGNTAEIVLTVLHHNILGIDEFLGRVTIPLNQLDIYDRPKNKFFPLQAKPGGKQKDRGQLEVKIAFNVKSGSLTNLSKKEKHRSSLSHVAQSVGGSLLSLGSAEKRKGIKKLAKSIGSKMHLKGKKKGDFDDGVSSIGSVGSLNMRSQTLNRHFKSRQTLDDADPGVVSDEDEFTFDDLSHKSSASSLNVSTNVPATFPTINKTPVVDNPLPSSPTTPVRTITKAVTPPVKPPRSETKLPQDEWETKLFGNSKKGSLRPGSSESLNRRSWDSSKLASQILEETEVTENSSKNEDNISVKSTPEIKREEKDGMFSKLKNNFRKDKDKIDLVERREKIRSTSHERVIIGGEREIIPEKVTNHISNELLQKFEGKTREDLILALVESQTDLEKQKKKLKDLEDYLDDLLLRVMETTPRILQNPYVTYNLSHKQYS
ncbi:rab11 family-interacting protein 2 [Euwallacea fornicatus]|uniref:rab11 family-interacting protein 2 n=1 Tax=Euwallacea fornicatus TaxID=995702 RepID=UPI00338EB8F7